MLPVVRLKSKQVLNSWGALLRFYSGHFIFNCLRIKSSKHEHDNLSLLWDHYAKLKIRHFNHFKVYNSVVFSASEMLCNHHFYLVAGHSHLHREADAHWEALPPPATALCSPSLWICLFWTFHINGIKACDSVFSMSIHGVTCTNISFLLRAEECPSYGHSAVCVSALVLMDIWAVSTFWWLWVMLFWALTYKLLFEPLFSSLMVIYT